MVYKILRELNKSARKIYVRVSEKWLVLHKIIANEIINLECDKKCPSFDKLSSNVYCIHHAVKFSTRKYRCALNNAYRLKSYLCSRDSDLNINLIDLNDGQSSNIGDPFTIRIVTVGVFPADQIPWVWTKPTAFVVNTDHHTRPVMHWVAVYVNKSCDGLYFDSLGISPVIPDHINRLQKILNHFVGIPFSLRETHPMYVVNNILCS